MLAACSPTASLRRPLTSLLPRFLSASSFEKPRLSKVKISEVLQRKHTERWVDSTICYTTSVSEATQIVIERGLSGLMVVDTETNINSESHQKGKGKTLGGRSEGYEELRRTFYTVTIDANLELRFS